MRLLWEAPNVQCWRKSEFVGRPWEAGLASHVICCGFRKLDCFVATRLLEVRMLLGLLGGSGCWCAWSPPVVRVGSICCPVGVYWVRCGGRVASVLLRVLRVLDGPCPCCHLRWLAESRRIELQPWSWVHGGPYVDFLGMHQLFVPPFTCWRRCCVPSLVCVCGSTSWPKTKGPIMVAKRWVHGRKAR